MTLNVAKNCELVKSISNLESKTFENYVSWKSNVTTELKYLRDIDISPVVKGQMNQKFDIFYFSSILSEMCLI